MSGLLVAFAVGFAVDSKLLAPHNPKLPALRESKLLALRGGSVDAATTTQAALMIASGLGSWIAPKESLAMYGVKKEATAGETFFMRAIAGIQFATAVRHSQHQPLRTPPPLVLSICTRCRPPSW
jgi:hypothetical protein